MDDSRNGGDGEYADPQYPIDYEPFRLNYAVPAWKNSKGHYGKRPKAPDYGTARHRDKHIYWSRDVFEQEWEMLFKRTWHWVGHLTDVPSANSFMVANIGPESVVVVRGEGDELTAFYNVCQHRGTRLLTQDFGKAKKLVCPFHRWEFGMKGELLSITDRESFRKKAICHDLNIPKVRVESWRGWIFINTDVDAEPLVDFLGEEFIDMMAPYDFEKALRIRDVVQEWPVNWKTAHEAFNEGYHVQATHPQFNRAVDAYHAQTDLYPNGHARSVYQFMSPTPHVARNLSPELAEEHKIFLREAGVKEEDFPSHWNEVPEAIINAKLAKKDYAIDYSKFSKGQLVDDWGVGFFPTTEAFFHPEGFLMQHWRPHPSDPEKCIFTAQVYAIPGIGELPSFMGVKEADLSGKKVLPRSYREPDDMECPGPVVAQDLVLVPRLQQGMRSDGFRGGVFSEQEVRIRQFYDEYYKYMRGHK